jgi:hypothetical protein
MNHFNLIMFLTTKKIKRKRICLNLSYLEIFDNYDVFNQQNIRLSQHKNKRKTTKNRIKRERSRIYI